MATAEAVASALGVLVPEAAIVGLPMRENGEIAPEAVTLPRRSGAELRPVARGTWHERDRPNR